LEEFQDTFQVDVKGQKQLSGVDVDAIYGTSSKRTANGEIEVERSIEEVAARIRSDGNDDNNIHIFVN
jgi:hypothetical protein